MIRIRKPPAVKDLRAVCRPHRQWEGLFFAFLPRVSIYVTWLLLWVNLSGNAATLLMNTLALFASVCMALDSYTMHVVGVVTLLFSIQLDWSDGELARFHRHEKKGIRFSQGESASTVYYAERASLVGNYLDQVYHLLSLAAPVMGISVHLLRHGLLVEGVLGFVAVGAFLLKECSAHLRKALLIEHYKSLRVSHDFGTNSPPPSPSRLVNFLFGHSGLRGPIKTVVLCVCVLGGLQRVLALGLSGAYTILLAREIITSVSSRRCWRL